MDLSFQLYRRHFIPLFYFSALVQTLPFAIGLMLSFFHWNPSLSMLREHPSQILFVVISFLVSIAFFALGESGLTYYVARIYLGQPVTLRDAFNAMCRRSVSILYSTGLKYFFISIAFSLVLIPFIISPFLPETINVFILLPGLFLLGFVLFIPWLVLAVRYLLVGPVVILEELKGLRALRRSSEIIRYDPGLGFFYWGETRLSLLLLVIAVINLLVVLLTRTPVLIASLGEILHGNLNPETMSIPLAVTLFTYLLNFLGSSLVAPLYVIAGTLFYYDVRVRKEAFDLELMADALKPQPPSSPQS